MKKPDNVHEFYGYDFPYDPVRTKILSEEEENAVIARVPEKARKRKAEREAGQLHHAPIYGK
ncbi:MAG: hypothetical protein NC078_05575 [Ruminococcus sp.]|nr:hypothetical protein [Ruminococcus sp.]